MIQLEQEAERLKERDAEALKHMTDEQALASWERFKEKRDIYVRAVLREIER